MKLALIMVAVLAMASTTAWANCGSCPGDKPAAKQAACCKAGDTVYACAKCSVVDVKAGKCTKCSTDLSAMHVLAMKDGSVSMCACATGCKCTVKADDATQCSCGKAVVTVKCASACKAAAPKVDAPKADAPKADAPKAETK
ncbi:MAG: hypothetical protein WCR06_02215 [bacterium]